jgi:type IV pilus assembly protein PilA
MPDDAPACPQCAAAVANAPTPPPAQAPPPPAAGSPWLNPPAQGQYPAPGQYPPAQYPGGYFPPPQQPPTDGKATASLVFGILSLIPCLLFLMGIPAVILGHLSRGDIKRSMGRLGGGGMALAGLIMGYISIGLSLLIIPAMLIPNLMRARMVANESAAASTVRTINTSQVTYSTSYPTSGYARDLAALGPGPNGGSCSDPGYNTAQHACLLDSILGAPNCTAGNWCTKNGYKFTMNSETRCPDNVNSGDIGCNYVVMATPESEVTGRKSYCSTADAVIRYRYGVFSRPISAEECSHWSVIY